MGSVRIQYVLLAYFNAVGVRIIDAVSVLRNVRNAILSSAIHTILSREIGVFVVSKSVAHVEQSYSSAIYHHPPENVEPVSKKHGTNYRIDKNLKSISFKTPDLSLLS